VSSCANKIGGGADDADEAMMRVPPLKRRAGCLIIKANKRRGRVS
jgi:hypothetical protein